LLCHPAQIDPKYDLFLSYVFFFRTFIMAKECYLV